MGSLLGGNFSSPTTVSPYGNLPYGIAGSLNRQELRPLRQGFGFNPTDKFMSQLATAKGPMADLIRNVQSMVPGMAGEAQQLGAETAMRGSQGYQTLTSQIDSYLANLPQFQQQANMGATDAASAVQDAFSPVTSSALYGQASRRMLEQMRPGEAARGLESSGSAQAAEDRSLQDLTFQFAQNQQAQQQAALQGLQGATGFANQMAGGGIGAANALMQGAGQAQDLQSQQFQLPMQQLNNILQLLMGGQQGSQQLLGTVTPQVGTTSQPDLWGIRY